MDTTNSVSSLRRKTTPTKSRKADKRIPIKVVYISNPMNFSVTSAEEFRALVQELTGQDAESPQDRPLRFRDSSSDDSDSVVGGGAGGGSGDQMDSSRETKNGDDGSTADGAAAITPQAEANDYIWEGQIGSTMEWFDVFDDVDDVFNTQISAFYESDHQVLHAV